MADTDSRAAAPRRRLLLGCVLVTWFCATAAAAAQTMAPHLLPFRAPAATRERDQALAGLRAPDSPPGTWMAVHVLYGDCACSDRIASHLATAKRPDGFTEVVLWAGPPRPSLAAIEARGLRVVRVATRDLAERFHVESAPLLVALGPDGGVRYAGGYTARKQGAAPLDHDILRRTRESHSPAPLPLFGCAVSERLRDAIRLFDNGGSP